VEQGRTTWPALTHAKQMLDRVGANTIGVVLNKVRATSGSYYYGYGNYGAPSSNGRAGSAGSDGTPVSESEAGSASTKDKIS
jgi:Mrp family chromosome partitioning ATPase